MQNLPDFGWRVSMATVESDGPFSVFFGIDRTLLILGGGGMELLVDGRPTMTTVASQPLSFAADRPVSARLVSGTVTDVNVMSRRGQFFHRVRRIAPIETDFAAGSDVPLALGPVELVGADGSVRLEAYDCALFDGPEESWRLTASKRLDCFRIDIGGHRTIP